MACSAAQCVHLLAVARARGALLRHAQAPTYDLHAEQLCGIARGLGQRGACLEAVVHQHLPIFHTEHCVFARWVRPPHPPSPHTRLAPHAFLACRLFHSMHAWRHLDMGGMLPLRPWQAK